MTRRIALALVALAGLTTTGCDALPRGAGPSAGLSELEQSAPAAEDCGGCYKFKSRPPAGINVPPAPYP